MHLFRTVIVGIASPVCSSLELACLHMIVRVNLGSCDSSSNVRLRTCLGSLCHRANVEILCGVNCYIGGNVLGCDSADYLDVWFRKKGGSGVQLVGFIEAGNCLLVHT